MASYVNDRVGNLYMLLRDSCPVSLNTPRKIFNDQSRIQRIRSLGILIMRTVDSDVRISHHYDLPVIRGIRKNLLTVRLACIWAERSFMSITCTNCCVVDYTIF